MSRLRVLLVDDQALFREGLALLLGTSPELEVVGEAADGRAAAERAATLRPDVVLMDLRMPGTDGVAGTRAIRAVAPDSKVLVLTTFDDDESVFDAISAGAVGYLLKDASRDDLVGAIRAAARGQSPLTPAVAAKLVARVAALQQTSAASARLEGMSERELEVLRLVARGASNKEIASELRITEGTVKNHLTHVFEKLGVSDRTQAALLARDAGLAGRER
ncbi:MAG: response regulator transcription factor [Sandaracinaceae bacterium]|nr:response regulator transcription factor [Sandaracinaceae bacterium]